MSSSLSVLIADDEELFRSAAEFFLERQGWSCCAVSDAKQALIHLNQQRFDVLVADYRMPGNENLELLQEVNSSYPDLPVILITGYPTVQSAIASLRLNVYDYLTKPFRLEKLGDLLKEVIEFRRVQTVIHEDSRRSEWLLDHSPIAVAILDRNLRYISANERWAQEWGIPKSSFIGRDHFRLFPNTPMSLHQALIRTLEGCSAKTDGVPVVMSDGTTKWLQWETQARRGEDGTVDGVVVFLGDVTPHHNARREHSRLARLSRTLIENTREMVFTLNDNGCILSANARATQLLGYETERLEDLVMGQIVHEEDRKELERNLVLARAGARCRSFEIRLRNASGRHLPAEIQLARYWAADEDGPGEIMVLMRDVTDQRTADTALRVSEGRYRAIYDNSPVGVFTLERDTLRVLSANPAFSQLTGYSLQELSSCRLHDLLEQDSLAALDGAMVNAKTAVSFLEWCFRTRWGGTIHTHVTLSPTLPGEDGCQLMGIAVDVSWRRTAEEAIRKNNAEKALVLNSMREGVFYLDNEMRYLWGNPAYWAAVGSSLPQATGEYCFRQLFNRNAACEGCPVMQALSGGETRESPEGGTAGCLRHICANPVHADNGSVAGVVCIGQP